MDDQRWTRPELRRELLLHHVMTDLRLETDRIEAVLDELAYEKLGLSRRPPVAAQAGHRQPRDKQQRPAA